MLQGAVSTTVMSVALFSLNDPVLSTTIGPFCCNCLRLQLGEFRKVNCDQELIIFHHCGQYKYAISRTAFRLLWEDALVKHVEEHGEISSFCSVDACIKCRKAGFSNALIKRTVTTSESGISIDANTTTGTTGSNADLVKDLRRSAKLSDAEVEDLLDMPLMFGSNFESEGLVADELAQHVSRLRALVIDCYSNHELSKLIGNACLRHKWRGNKCLFCSAEGTTHQYFLEHILSDCHFAKMRKEGIYPLQCDFKAVTEMITAVVHSFEEKKRPSLPFFFGSPDSKKSISDSTLYGALRFIRYRISFLSQDKIQNTMEKYYKRSQECNFCKKSLTATERLSHMLTEEHIEKVKSNNRYFTSWDLNQIEDLITKIEKM